MQSRDRQKGTVVTADGAQLSFERFGNSKGATLLLLHGGMGSGDDFASFAKQLDEFRIVTLDSRGHGRSTLGSAPMTYAQLAQDALLLLDHLDCSRVSLIGFSDGGIVGFRLASEHQQRIEKLVTIGASHRVTVPTKTILEKVTAASWDTKFPQTKPAYEQKNPQPDFAGFFAKTQKMWLDTSATGYPADRIAAIACPTLVIRGDTDHLCSLEEASEQRRVIANSRFLNVPGAGHVAFQDQESICLWAIKSFLAGR